ncbi:hypothetical protein [Mycolicibacterium mageritense]|uniref:hypothetical protein n=1 Tax=Mycolicibacterium mageritense TaxID=53462 RepID=UPI001E4A0D13|nr:hypothetical protein [Mycolicibacterium mageritense]MCC9184053.1 hypothetical protein [Mycolicibacterium mageritense]
MPVLVIAVVVGLIVGGVVVWRSVRGTNAHIDATIGTPKDLLIAFSLEKKPVPGWKVSAADIGLPPEVGVGSLFASTKDKAYFITDRTDSQGLSPAGWVYGVDIHSGKLLFQPIELTGFRGNPLGDCYGNGPGTAVCLAEGDPEVGLAQLIWIIDLEQGKVTFTGPTDLFPQGESASDKYVVAAIGNYLGETRLVARREGEGVYGLGPNGERTWFVPGGGSIFNPGYLQVSDIPAQTVAMQNPLPSDPEAPYRMFSALDGADLTPTPPEGTIIRKALVYNGGFAYSFQESGKGDGLLFYDTAGQLVARYLDENYDLTPVENQVMPMARLRSKPAKWQVFSAAGDLVTSIPAPTPGIYFRVIGDKIYLDQGGTDDRWQQWDLSTGESGPVCQLGLSHDYVGSDGSIVIVGGGLESNTVRAVDPSTCAIAWELTEQETGEWLRLWKVGTGLVQRTRYELTELRAG